MRDVRWGLGWGLWFGVAYSALGLLAYVAGPSKARTIGVLATVIAVYLVGGLLGGTIVGLLRPLTRTRLGSALVGVVAGVPVCLGFVVASKGAPSRWTAGSIAAAVLTALVLGSIIGFRSWEPPSDDGPSR